MEENAAVVSAGSVNEMEPEPKKLATPLTDTPQSDGTIAESIPETVTNNVTDSEKESLEPCPQIDGVEQNTSNVEEPIPVKVSEENQNDSHKSEEVVANELITLDKVPIDSSNVILDENLNANVQAPDTEKVNSSHPEDSQIVEIRKTVETKTATSNGGEDKDESVKENTEEVVIDEVEVKSEPEVDENDTSVKIINVEIQASQEMDKPSQKASVPAKNVVESIASDWNFAEEVVEPEKPAKSSAEIIALDWDDNESRDLKNDNKEDKNEGNNVNGTSDAVFEKVPDGKNDEIIIFDEISEIQFDESNATEITFVTVNENNEIVESNVETQAKIETSNVKPVGKRKSRNSLPDYLLGHSDRPGAQARMGVKIPCRHLRSVICSKAELEKEVVEVKTIRNPDIPPGGDVLFATKLFQNLASKILKNKTSSNTLTSNAQPTKKVEPRKKVSDQELLKILEGEEDGIDVYNMQKEVKEASPPLLTAENSMQVINKHIHNTPPELDVSPTMTSLPSTSAAGLVTLSYGNVIMDPDLAREIALKQLSELPENVPRRRGRQAKTIVEINVPNTKIIDNNEGTTDPFTFDEGVKTESPIKYESGTVKTYSRKSITEEPELSEIPVPVEIIENETGVDKTSFRRTIKKGSHTPASTTNRKSKAESSLTISSDSSTSTPNNSKVQVSTRSRIIKKKVIWDPSSNAPTGTPPIKVDTSPSKLKKKADKIEEEIPRKKHKIIPKVATPKEHKETDPNDTKLTKAKEASPEVSDKVSEKETKVEKISRLNRKKKRFSEVDKLLMDEGALNMIYAVEKDDKTPISKTKQKVISIDNFTKEMNKKKRMIMSALITTPEVNAKALRKKDLSTPSSNSTNTPQRKKSHDSIRSSIQSPPPSPSSMFPPRAEASRIIRRHSSSSSFSSESLTPRRLSVVEADKSKENADNTFWNDVPDSKEAKSESTPRTTKRKRGVPIFVKKPEEKTYRGKPSEVTPPKHEKKLRLQKATAAKEENDKADGGKQTSKKEVIPDAESYASLVKTLDSDNQQRQKENDEKQRTSGRQNAGTYNYKEISLRKFENLVQIILTPQSTKIKNALNVVVMRELCDALNTLKKDLSCRVVMLTSTGSVFCRGLDYASLIHSNADKRKALAQEMAFAVKELVQTLGHFPKPIIAGVQGAVFGLGVSILPLCDLVFVSDKATFAMNHSKLGCIPEGAATVLIPHVASHAVASELLLAGHTLTATEALRHGLATRILWPEGYLKELIPICKAIALNPSQGMNSTKALIKHSMLIKMEAALDSETHLLIQHWTSLECQQNFKNALENDSW